MSYSVSSIADKILAYGATAQDGELISNLKLQKLLYYVQGFHLAAFGTPLFDADIEAWMYGPVVPEVYNHYQCYGNKGIEPSGKSIITLTEEKGEEELFNEVLRIYGNYSAIGLMNLTHNEMPWKTTVTGKGNVISPEKMTTFFRSRLS